MSASLVSEQVLEVELRNRRTSLNGTHNVLLTVDSNGPFTNSTVFRSLSLPLSVCVALSVCFINRWKRVWANMCLEIIYLKLQFYFYTHDILILWSGTII